MTTKNASQIAPARVPFGTVEGEAVLQIVQDYWEQLRRNQQVPLRSDLAPASLDRALPHCFIVERVAPEVARMRVAGQALRDILNMDARGMPLSAFLSPDARAMLGPMIEAAFTQPQVLEIALQTERTLSRASTKARMIIMPLRDDLGRTARLFGALVTDRPIRLGARRFNLAEEPVVQHRILRLSSGEVRLVATAETPAPGAPRGKAALRLVVDNT